MTMNQEFTKEQLAELISVFQTESAEHIKALTEIFLALEKKGGQETVDLLGRAFRETHSLKGAAGTLGFGRVEVLTHRLEDVVGYLNREGKKVASETIDLLLATLDIIQSATRDSAPGDNDLEMDEAKQVRRLEVLLEAGEETAGEPEHDKGSRRRRPSSLLPPDQLENLCNVFRAEAIEHIKSLAEVFFLLEDGSVDPADQITQAFRQAHSLKGSAATLGFGRVETMTHHLEDVLGRLNQLKKAVSAEEVDLLLTALDAIRRSIDSSELGDERLTEEEAKVAASLEKLADRLARTEPRKELEKVVAKAQARKSVPPEKEDKAAKDLTSAPPEAEKPKDEFIRIQESKVDAVFAQVAELFEANLQIESMVPALTRFSVVATDISARLNTLLKEFEDTAYETELYPAAEKARNLSIQLGSTLKQFGQDEYQLSKLIGGVQEELRKIRLAPVSTIFIMIRRQVREISKTTGKQLELFLDGGEYAIDRKVLDAIEEPLVHILRNTASHGIETPEEREMAGKDPTGKIRLAARHTGDAVEITVTDDGRGIDPDVIRMALVKKRLASESQAAKLSKDQLYDHLFESGFSTKAGVSKISGRGVGLDVVKYSVERLGGEVHLNSYIGKGTTISFRLPLAMSTVRCLLVRIADRVLAIPASNVEKVIIPRPEHIKTIGGGEVIVFRDQNVPFGSLGEHLGLTTAKSETGEKSRTVVIISFGERLFAFDIEELIEYSQLILKPLGDLLERVPNLSGISLLGTGEVALILNPSDLVRTAGGARGMSKPRFPIADEPSRTIHILVVDDSIATRTLEKNLLESAGYVVFTASDGYKALDVLATNNCDLVVSDVQMPNMDGIELTRTLKSRSQYSAIPVILITSLGSDEDKMRGLAAGADAYIVKKDLTQGELVDTINQLL
ncbi:MAG: hybrid sensor histidine kinase/response regulator [Deltaproteobacteria bacterium]|nr:hybrid sensor histidine kinase/response regulator [Deltaproteobacteria bacterium]